jgi:hypothetical protein
MIDLETPYLRRTVTGLGSKGDLNNTKVSSIVGFRSEGSRIYSSEST